MDNIDWCITLVAVWHWSLDEIGHWMTLDIGWHWTLDNIGHWITLVDGLHWSKDHIGWWIECITLVIVMIIIVVVVVLVFFDVVVNVVFVIDVEAWFTLLILKAFCTLIFIVWRRLDVNCRCCHRYFLKIVFVFFFTFRVFKGFVFTYS